MYIINKVMKYFYPDPDPVLEAARKDYLEYTKSDEFQKFKQHHDVDLIPVTYPVTAPPAPLCYLKSIQENLKAMEEMDLNDKILTAIEMHNRILEEAIKLKNGLPQIQDIEMDHFRKPGRTPGSKCLCH